MSDDIIQH